MRTKLAPTIQKNVAIGAAPPPSTTHQHLPFSLTKRERGKERTSKPKDRNPNDHQSGIKVLLSNGGVTELNVFSDESTDCCETAH